MGTTENPALPTVWTESHERTAKTPPALVLVHGGGHAGDCWDLTVEELHKQAPEQHVLTVDLPGHGSKPGNLETATIAEWVDSIVADIEAAGLVDIVIVGHSMAGLTVPWSPGSECAHDRHRDEQVNSVGASPELLPALDAYLGVCCHNTSITVSGPVSKHPADIIGPAPTSL